MNIKIDPINIVIIDLLASGFVSSKNNKQIIGTKKPIKIDIPPILTTSLLCCFLLFGLSTNENLKPKLFTKGIEI